MLSYRTNTTDTLPNGQKKKKVQQRETGVKVTSTRDFTLLGRFRAESVDRLCVVTKFTTPIICLIKSIIIILVNGFCIYHKFVSGIHVSSKFDINKKKKIKIKVVISGCYHTGKALVGVFYIHQQKVFIALDCF